MKVTVLKRGLRVDRLGLLPVGWRGELPDSVAKLFLRQGSVERAETTELRERPAPAVGAPSSASPAAQASPQTTASVSGRGKRKTRKHAESS